jgi:hypothetical protein
MQLFLRRGRKAETRKRNSFILRLIVPGALIFWTVLLALPDIAAAQQTSSFTFQVDSTRGWQSTTLKVAAGQKLSFSTVGSWSVDYRNFSYVGTQGYTPQEDARIYQGCKIATSQPYGVLLVRLGDDPGYQVLGASGVLTANYDGPVSFRINDADACLGDNAGSVNVTATGTGLSNVSDFPSFYCITSQTSPNTFCQNTYKTPVPIGEEVPEPKWVQWINLPDAPECAIPALVLTGSIVALFIPGAGEIIAPGFIIIKSTGAVITGATVVQKATDIAQRLSQAGVKDLNDIRWWEIVAQGVIEFGTDKVSVPACQRWINELKALN